MIVESDRPLPGLRPNECLRSADVHVAVGFLPSILADLETNSSPWYIRPAKDGLRPDTLRVWLGDAGRLLLLRFADGARFAIDRRGEHIWIETESNERLHDAVAYLFGPLLAVVLRLRGIVSLHASAVRVGDSALLFLGRPGAGKSTLAVYFAARGHAVLSDDLVPIQEHADRLLATPGFPWLRPRRESAAMLAALIPSGIAMASLWEDAFLDLSLDQPGLTVATDSLPVGVVCLIDPPQARPRATVVPPTEALWEFLGATWAARLPGRSERMHMFETLGRLASTVPVRRVSASPDAGGFRALYDLILAECATAAGTAA